MTHVRPSVLRFVTLTHCYVAEHCRMSSDHRSPTQLHKSVVLPKRSRASAGSRQQMRLNSVEGARLSEKHVLSLNPS